MNKRLFSVFHIVVSRCTETFHKKLVTKNSTRKRLSLLCRYFLRPIRDKSTPNVGSPFYILLLVSLCVVQSIVPVYPNLDCRLRHTRTRWDLDVSLVRSISVPVHKVVPQDVQVPGLPLSQHPRLPLGPCFGLLLRPALHPDQGYDSPYPSGRLLQCVTVHKP